MKCPKCNNEVKKHSKKCKNCGSPIKKEPKDHMEKLPEIIETPNKILESESLEKTKEIKVEAIPLKVKPVKTPKKDNKKIEKDTNINWQDNVFSSIKIVIVFLLLLINVLFIVKLINGEEKNKTTNKEKEPTITEHAPSNILGKWRSSNNGLFSFEDDYNFYWYEYYDDLKNNYYSGTYNFKKGEEALKEMGYTKEEFNIEFGTDIKIENVYSINMVPTSVIKANTNVTLHELKENESWWFILMVKNDGTAIAYNKTLDLRYNLVKN